MASSNVPPPAPPPITHPTLSFPDPLSRTVCQHHRNHARILALRQKIASQNALITSNLTLLASTRSDLLSTPTSLPDKTRRDVPYRELLAYAKRISRFTAPPGFRSQTALDAAEGKEGIGLESLDRLEKQWLDPLTGVQFTPWPGEEVIKRGALAEIQGMVERGVDPEGVGRGDVGGEEVKIEGEGGDGEGGGGADVIIREGNGRVQREEKPKVFGGLDLYDPDEG